MRKVADHTTVQLLSLLVIGSRQNQRAAIEQTIRQEIDKSPVAIEHLSIGFATGSSKNSCITISTTALGVDEPIGQLHECTFWGLREQIASKVAIVAGCICSVTFMGAHGQVCHEIGRPKQQIRL